MIVHEVMRHKHSHRHDDGHHDHYHQDISPSVRHIHTIMNIHTWSTDTRIGQTFIIAILINMAKYG